MVPTYVRININFRDQSHPNEKTKNNDTYGFRREKEFRKMMPWFQIDLVNEFVNLMAQQLNLKTHVTEPDTLRFQHA